MRLALLAVALGCSFAVVSCATMSGKAEKDDLKPVTEAFRDRIRWKDFRQASELIVPERRDSFLKARKEAKDERDLNVTDYTLDDAKVDEASGTALVVAHVSWYRLPSTSEETETITSVFAWREGSWMLESQDSGPFEDLRPAKKKAKKQFADAGL